VTQRNHRKRFLFNKNVAKEVGNAVCIFPHFLQVRKGMVTLKPQSNGSLYSNTVIGTLAGDELTVTFDTARGRA